MPKEVIVLVILEDAQGNYALQHRDDLPEVAYRDQWGLFGGHVERGEMPAEAAARELQEELGIEIQLQKLREIETFNIEDRAYYVFYNRTANKLEEAKLQEGQDFALFSRTDCESGLLKEKEIVPHHLSVLKRYWD